MLVERRDRVRLERRREGRHAACDGLLLQGTTAANLRRAQPGEGVGAVGGSQHVCAAESVVGARWVTCGGALRPVGEQSTGRGI